MTRGGSTGCGRRESCQRKRLVILGAIFVLNTAALVFYLWHDRLAIVKVQPLQTTKWKAWRKWSERDGQQARRKILSYSRDEYSKMHFLHPNSHQNESTIVFTIVTTNRAINRIKEYKPLYFSQTFASFLKRLQHWDISSSGFNVQLTLCNVDTSPYEHEEANLAINQTNISTFVRFETRPTYQYNRFQKEADDYMFCLNRSFAIPSAKYVVLVEDDTLPNALLMPVVSNIVKQHFALPSRASETGFIKLHHPERFQAYWSRFPQRWCELVLLATLAGALGASLAHWRFRGRRCTLVAFLVCFLFVAVTLLIVGRRYVLRLRTYFVALHWVVEAPLCCTPAVLFSSRSQGAVQQYFKSKTFGQQFPKDFALEDMRQDLGLKGYLVEPNLFTHIGVFSSLRNFDMNGILNRIGNNF